MGFWRRSGAAAFFAVLLSQLAVAQELRAPTLDYAPPEDEWRKITINTVCDDDTRICASAVDISRTPGVDLIVTVCLSSAFPGSVALYDASGRPRFARPTTDEEINALLTSIDDIALPVRSGDCVIFAGQHIRVLNLGPTLGEFDADIFYRFEAAAPAQG